MTTTTWMRTIGRVAFINCDPLFYGLPDTWNVLSAPPSWLTGHVLRRDCILAPIPAADYAKHADELVLLPDIGIGSQGEVGSVLLFGAVPLESMQTIALPTDSATSVALLKHLITQRGLKVNYVSTGPDYDSMMALADGALLIGDRALQAAREVPEMVQLDLGKAWMELENLPMIFGVFVARRDTPVEALKEAHGALLDNLVAFETDAQRRRSVIEWSSTKSDLTHQRLDQYYGEVFNRLNSHHLQGLFRFLQQACNMAEPAEFAWD
ncbi:MAG: menaquinone biosynthesis protein [Candidatus Poseidonia sp.]|nr:menaquinone biosynthesis protein [Poseidonia sp.]